MAARTRPVRSLLAAMVLAAACLHFATAARAVEPDEILSDPALEARARHLSAGLRCLVCQNQSIDDSAAPLAKDLRVIVRERLRAGDSDQAVRNFVVARYGKFVLLKPPFGLDTLLLWSAPLGVLIIVGAGVALALRRRRSAAETPLSPDELARLDRVLSQDRR